MNYFKYAILNIINFQYKIYNYLLLRYRKVQYTKDIQIQGKLAIYGNGQIRIGPHVKINSSERSNPIGGDIKTILVTIENGTISIGENTGISNVSIVAMKSVSIGKNVRIGGGTKIYDSDFHSLDYDTRIGQNDNDIRMNPVVICDGAFIGAHSIILKGVKIGEKSIIGAGSVVTKEVPAFEIWAGNPAKFIRSI